MTSARLRLPDASLKPWTNTPPTARGPRQVLRPTRVPSEDAVFVLPDEVA